MLMLLLLLISLFSATIVEYTLNIEYKWMTIDNFTKAVICVNGLNVGPLIRCNKGDTLRINIVNSLWDKYVTIHWHGVDMRGTPWMDGVPFITECPIQSSTNKIYEFIVDKSGTFWYHGHVEMQRDDAFYGALIVDDLNSTINYDEEYIVMISDFYQQYSEELVQMLTSSNFHWPGAPKTLLVNGMNNFNISLTYGKIYLIRFISVTTHSYLNISIPHHNVTIVEVEGTYTNKFDTSNIWINSGERYAGLLHANNPGCYFINISSMSDPINILMGLIYDSCNSTNFISSINNNFFNTSFLTNKYPSELPKPNKNLSIYMNVHKVNGDGRAFTFNNVSFIFPTIPILLSYYLGTYTSNNRTLIIDVELGDVIDIELINDSKFQHSFHLHLHSFYVLNSDNPIKRDTVTIENGQSVTIRVLFDNPSVSLVHCHSDFHVVLHLVMVFAYSPETIPRPPNNFSICGKTINEIKQQKHLFDIIYSLTAVTIFIIVLLVGLLFYVYKSRKLNYERLRLIV